ncbi:MAG: sulfatase-like hydrolase/transferase, partial [Phycisphaerales bacterium]
MKSISRRDFIKGLVISASASSIPVLAERNRATRPNVIILFIDDLAYGELGAFGCPDIPTPHMDSLAANGVKCTNSYITNP